MWFKWCITQLLESTKKDKSIFLIFTNNNFQQGCKPLDRLIFYCVSVWVVSSKAKENNIKNKLLHHKCRNQMKFLELSLRSKFIFVTFIAEVFLLGIWLFDISVLKSYNVDLNYKIHSLQKDFKSTNIFVLSKGS